MFLSSPGIPGAFAGQESVDSPGDEPTITELMKNPSKVIGILRYYAAKNMLCCNNYDYYLLC